MSATKAFIIGWVLCMQVIFISGDNGLEITAPEELKGVYLSSRVLPYPEVFSVSGIMAISDPFPACSEIQNTLRIDSKGANVIVLIGADSCYASEAIKRVMKIPNVVGVVVEARDGFVGRDESWYSGSKEDLPSFPAVEISREYGERIRMLIEDDKIVQAVLTTPSSNPTIEILNGPAGIVVRSIFTLLAFFYIGMTLYKIIGFIRNDGIWPITLSFPKVSLLIIFVIDILLYILVIDPINVGTQVNPIAWYFVNYTFMFLCLTVIMLEALYWQEALQTIKQGHFKLLDKMKIPAVVLFGLWWCAYIVICILTGFGYYQEAQIMYVTAEVAAEIFSIYFLVTGVKVVRAFGKTDKPVTGRRKYTRLSVMVLISGIGIVILWVGAILGATHLNHTDPSTSFGITIISYIGLFTIVFAQVMVFQVPNQSNWFCLSTKTSDGADRLSNTNTTKAEITSVDKPPATV